MAEIPDGMVVVTREEFFALLKADTRDIMPRHNQPDYTIWETKGREAWGWTVPGWRNPGVSKVYAVVRTVVKKASATE
jgi:hypothetical protein